MTLLATIALSCLVSVGVMAQENVVVKGLP